MATERPTPPDGATEMTVDREDEEQEVELDPGETHQGVLLSIREGESQYGDWWELRLRDTVTDEGIYRYFAESNVKPLCREGDLEEGSEYWFCKDVTSEDVNGNEHFPVEVREIE